MKNKLSLYNSTESVLKSSLRFTDDFLKAAGFIECEFEDHWCFPKKFTRSSIHVLNPNTSGLNYDYNDYDQLEECL